MNKRIRSCAAFLCAIVMIFSLCGVGVVAAADAPAIDENALSHSVAASIQNLQSGEQIAILSNRAMSRSANSITETFVDKVETEGTFKYVPFTLGQGHVAQITLDCPDNANLDYDLFLYAIDAEGNLLYLADASDLTTYINTNGETLDEHIGYHYTGTTSQAFAAIIYARVGGSSEETFTLTLSLDFASNWDAFEPNDSPYNPYDKTVSVGETFTPTLNLNVINDQDWFYLIPSSSDCDTLTIPVSTNYQAEMYVANGAQMQMVPSTVANGEETFELSSTGNYLKIYSGRSGQDPAFSYSPFSIPMEFSDSTAVPTPTGPFQFTIEMDGDQGDNSYVNYGPYVDYAEGFDRKFRYRDSLNPTVTVEDANGDPLVGVTVRVRLVSSFWSEASGYHVQDTFYSDTVTDATGTATITITPMTSAGTYSILLDDGPHVYRHHVDIDRLTFYVDGMESSGTETILVYRLAYSEYVSS